MIDNLILGAIIIVGCYFALQIFNIILTVLINPLVDLSDIDTDDNIDIQCSSVTNNEMVLDGDKKVESETIILKKDKANE